MNQKHQHSKYVNITIFIFSLSILILFSGCVADHRYCEKDTDCMCGIDKFGNCDYGNMNYIQQSRQCRDFCENLTLQGELKCIRKKCTFVSVKKVGDGPTGI